MEKCYICRNPIIDYHNDYNKICKSCGEFNLQMRNYYTNLEGYVAVVTGGRIKVGYYSALKLLRAGAKVIVTTRFPFNALERYCNEEDYNIWKDNLTICEVDLKKVGIIESFIKYVESNFLYVDIIVNNAAQTIKKSREYYMELEANEKMLNSSYISEGKNHKQLGLVSNSKMSMERATKEIINIEETENYNSWIATPEEISLYEFLEVQVINVTSPFMLCTKLKKMMIKSENKNKFIINVSSLEGMFSEKRKSSKHIHTNMAKASLNMLTKSLAKDYAKDRIFTFSVDPGWVSNQFPTAWTGYCNKEFISPLTYEDAAARICNPIFKYLEVDRLDEFGVLIKDYKITEW